MNTPKHTEWTCHPISGAGTVKYWGICGSKGRIVDVPRHVPNYTPDEQEAHAKQIVRAVNSHAELVEALQTALNVMAAIAIGDLKKITRDSPAIAQARAALSKAQ